MFCRLLPDFPFDPYGSKYFSHHHQLMGVFLIWVAKKDNVYRVIHLPADLALGCIGINIHISVSCLHYSAKFLSVISRAWKIMF